MQDGVIADVNAMFDYLMFVCQWTEYTSGYTDENGEDIDFEYLDCLTYQDKEYLVLMPADEAETQIVILEVEPVDDENENYLAVDDEAVLDAVYGMFKEKYKDVLTFED